MDNKISTHSPISDNCRMDIVHIHYLPYKIFQVIRQVNRDLFHNFLFSYTLYPGQYCHLQYVYPSSPSDFNFDLRFYEKFSGNFEEKRIGYYILFSISFACSRGCSWHKNYYGQVGKPFRIYNVLQCFTVCLYTSYYFII